eukprot:g33847.t1
MVRTNYQGLLQVFAAFDETKSGLISVEDLKAIFNNFVFPLSNEIFDRLMDRNDVIALERVQRRSDSLELFSLEQRRMRWAVWEKQIEMHEIMRGIDRNKLFPLEESLMTEEQGFKISQCSKVVRIWNELPEEVVEAGTITTFNRHLDEYMNRKGLEGYGPNAGK